MLLTQHYSQPIDLKALTVPIAGNVAASAVRRVTLNGERHDQPS